MPFLSFSNPKNRVPLVAVLLLLEFMAILWLRRSPANDHTPTEFPPFKTEDSQQPYVLLRTVSRIQRKPKNSQEMAADGIEAQMKTLKGRSAVVLDQGAISIGEQRIKQQEKEFLDITSGTTLQQEQQFQQQREQQQQHRHHHHHRAPAVETKSTGKLGKPDDVIGTMSMSTPATPQSQAAQPTIISSKVGKSSKRNKMIKNVKSKKGNAKDKGNNRQAIVQKSRAERKLGQLIPALDENGVIIEDHFISPRDSDGDGIPDYYVLLRPSTNKYMMDVGLFDEEGAVPPVPAGLPFVENSPSASAPGTPLLNNNVA
ncbi:hypothetical protein BG004_006295 [Podila humilis]|nr:hypothetical protein BG004_006295 [Podila humilis]